MRLLTREQVKAARANAGNALDAVGQFAGSRRARILVLMLFAVQAVLLAFVVRPGVPPDETNHINFIQYYAQHSLSPVFSHQQPTYNLGDKTREVDYLYHYVMSLVYRILPMTPEAKYIAIRLFSVAIALATFIVLTRIARKLHISEAVTTVALLIVSNLPMVLMLSAAINNDAAVWLGVTLAVLLLVRLWERPSWLDLLLLGEIIIVGGLVKRTMLAFGLIFGILGLLVFVRSYRSFLAKPPRLDWRLVVILVAMLVSLGLATERIGGNVVRYHTPTPSCEQVQDVQSCSVFWLNVRAQNLAQQPKAPLLPIPTFIVFWTGTSLFNIVDIQTQAWRHEVMPLQWLTPLLGLLLVGGLAYGLRSDIPRRRQEHATPYRLGVMGLGFSVLVVHVVYNYLDYRGTHVFGLAVNGRYIIPGILLLSLLAGYYWSRLLVRHPRWLTAAAFVVVIGVIIGSGLLMMLRNPQLRLG